MDQAPKECELCGAEISRPANQAMRACDMCARKLGIIAMPPSRRPPQPCARCNGLHFVRVIPREYTSDDGGDWNRQVISPMYATSIPPGIKSTWLLGKHLAAVELGALGRGILEMHICRGCGAVEWGCIDLENIPIHPHVMTELVDLTPDTPFRG